MTKVRYVLEHCCGLIDFERVIQMFLDHLRAWEKQLDTPVPANQLVKVYCQRQWLTQLLGKGWPNKQLRGVCQSQDPSYFYKLFDEVRGDLLAMVFRNQHHRPSQSPDLLDAIQAGHVAEMPAMALDVLDWCLLRVASVTEGVPIEACFHCLGAGGEPFDNRDGYQAPGTCLACHGQRYVAPEDNTKARQRLAEEEAAHLEQMRLATALAEARAKCAQDRCDHLD